MNKQLKGIDKVSEYTKLSNLMLLNIQRDYEFPMYRGKDSIWVAYSNDLDKWLKAQGFSDWDKVTISELDRNKLKKMRQGPGRVIQGDMNRMCAELQIAPGSFVYFQGYAGNPIERIEGTNQFSVDLNRWTDFLDSVQNPASPRRNW